METDNFFSLSSKSHSDEFIQLDDILYLEGKINYTFIHLKSGKVKVSCRTLLHHITYHLNSSFLRIHKAFCINALYIKSYDKRSEPDFVILEGNKKLAVARRRLKVLHGIGNQCIN